MGKVLKARGEIMGINGLGRPSAAEKYDNMHEYLNEYVFKIKDALFLLKDDELKKRKEYNAAVAKVNLQTQKLEKAYEGLEKFRK